MSEMIQVIGIGAGGQVKVVLDILRRMGGFTVAGLLDADTAKHGQVVAGVPVLGDEGQLDALRRRGVTHAFNAVGANPDTRPRQAVYERLVARGMAVIRAIHPSAMIADADAVAAGVLAMARVVVNPGASVGENALLNTGCVVEHDVSVGPHAFVGPGATLTGGVQVGAGAFIGAGAVVLPGVSVGARAVVGAGAVVTRSVQPGMVVVGVPARVVRSTAVDRPEAM